MQGDMKVWPAETPVDGDAQLRVLEGDMKVWPAEVHVDGYAQLRMSEGDDETPLSSAPSGRSDRG